MSKYLLICLIIYVFCITSVCFCVSLEIIKEEAYTIDKKDYYFDYDRISALLIGNDTIISTSSAGIWVKYPAIQRWQKLMDCDSDVQWNDEDFKKNRWDSKILAPPNGMWKNSISDKILIHIPSSINLRSLYLEKDNCYIDVDKKELDKFRGSYANFNFSNEHIVCGLYSYDKNQNLVEIHNIKNGKIIDSYKIFKMPSGLRENLNSVWLSNPSSFSLLNPNNNTIWVSVWGYQFLYIIDMKGELLDSVHIYQSDYLTPQPPISKLRTQAVWRDWLSKWTPVRNFNFVSPGFFILQYRTGFEVVENDTIPLYSTVIWDENKQPIDLEIDKHWQVAGVQPDGIIIFAHYKIEADKRQILLTIAKIIP